MEDTTSRAQVREVEGSTAPGRSRFVEGGRRRRRERDWKWCLGKEGSNNARGREREQVPTGLRRRFGWEGRESLARNGTDRPDSEGGRERGRE